MTPDARVSRHCPFERLYRVVPKTMYTMHDVSARCYTRAYASIIITARAHAQNGMQYWLCSVLVYILFSQFDLTCSSQNTFVDAVFLLAAGGSVITDVVSVTSLSSLFTTVPVPMALGPLAAELGGYVLAIGFYVSIKKILICNKILLAAQ